MVRTCECVSAGARCSLALFHSFVCLCSVSVAFSLYAFVCLWLWIRVPVGRAGPNVAVAVCVPVSHVLPSHVQIVPKLPEAKQRTKVQFLLGDATVYDWSDATMWFANSTCFDEALMLKLAVVAGKRLSVCSWVRGFVPHSLCSPASIGDVRWKRIGLYRKIWPTKFAAA